MDAAVGKGVAQRASPGFHCCSGPVSLGFTRQKVVGVSFVGRRSELILLRQRLSDLGTGRGGVGLIVGEPGIGKSALVE
jgi:hypothetical protein